MYIRTKLDGESSFSAVAMNAPEASLNWTVPLRVQVIDLPAHEPKTVSVRVNVLWEDVDKKEFKLTGELDWESADGQHKGVLKSDSVTIDAEPLSNELVESFAAEFVEGSLSFFL